MKQYTTPDQTAKLIELGFEKPKGISGYYQRGPYEYDTETNTKMEDGYEIATFRVLPTGGIITKMICPISSVHQLQHALRLAGNEKEIEL